MRRYKLMIPGPVGVHEEVLSEFLKGPEAHYGTDWAEFYIETCSRINELIGNTGGQTFLIPGSGSTGLEVAINTFLRESDNCLVLTNGFFGERLFKIAKSYSRNVEVMEFDEGDPIYPEKVEKKLSQRRYDVVLLVHCETSTGVLNPVKFIAELTSERGILLIVDGISSVGIEEYEMKNWRIQVTVTASQKGLETLPGLSIVSVDEELLVRLDDYGERGWYTNLKVWKDYYNNWKTWHPFPVTIPTNLVRSLRKSLEMIERSGGIERRIKLHENASNMVREAMKNVGLELFAKEGFHSHGVTSVSSRGRFEPKELVDFLKARYGIQIAGSLGKMREHVFRIGHMGYEGTKLSNIIPLLVGIEEFLRSKGLDIPPGKILERLSTTTDFCG